MEESKAQETPADTDSSGPRADPPVSDAASLRQTPIPAAAPIPDGAVLAPPVHSEVGAPQPTKKYGQFTSGPPRVPLTPDQLRKRKHLFYPSELADHIKKTGKRRWCIEGILLQQSVGLIVGASGVGKSSLCYQAAICKAAGVPWLGFNMEPGLVFYADYENSPEQQLEMVTTIAKFLGVPASYEENLILWNYNHHLELRQNETNLLAEVQEYKPALTFIDTVASFDAKVDGENKDVSGIVMHLRDANRHTGGSMILLHHFRKAREKDKAPNFESAPVPELLEQIRGASRLVNASSARMVVGSVSEESRLNSKKPSQESAIAMVLRGMVQGVGEIPAVYIERCYDEEGQPHGYRALTGAALLRNPDKEAAFHNLPRRFRFKDVKAFYGDHDQQRDRFLKACIGLKLLEKGVDGWYTKI